MVFMASVVMGSSVEDRTGLSARCSRGIYEESALRDLALLGFDCFLYWDRALSNMLILRIIYVRKWLKWPIATH